MRRTENPYIRFFGRTALTETCWLWQGQRSHGGYAYFYLDGRKQYGHRLSYEWFVGPVPAGLELDHLCRVRHCVNPAHLEAVSRRENLLRGETIIADQVRRTHCPHGHEYTPENTGITHGKRRCRACDRNNHRERRAAA